MFDPLRRLKFLPWIALLQVALLTLLVVVAVEWLVSALVQLFPSLLSLLSLVLSPPLGILTQLAIAVGIGVLAVIVLRRRFPQIQITVSILWALVPCLALWWFLRTFIPLPSLIGDLDFPVIIGVMVGIFGKGKAYTRW